MPRKKKEPEAEGIAAGEVAAGAAVALAGAAVAAAPRIARALRGEGKPIPSLPQNARAQRLAKRLAKKAAKRDANKGAQTG
jgi:hypothetical protein